MRKNMPTKRKTTAKKPGPRGPGTAARKSPSSRKKRAPKAPLTVVKTPVAKITPEQQIVGATFLGKILDFYAHPGVIVLTLEASLALGDTIRVKGHTTDLTQKVESLQVNHVTVQSAAAGESVGIKIVDRARIGDAVYKI